VNAWSRFLRQPQNLWARRALFQIHLWSGIGIGLYILAVSVTGAVLVYRVELARALSEKPVAVTGERLTIEQLKEAAARAYPGYAVTGTLRSRNPARPVELHLERNGLKKERYFNPYSGADLGDVYPIGMRALNWTLDLHDNLLAGQTGRMANGIGALLLIVLALTGLVIWWPGVQRWRRSLWLRWTGNWTAFNWDLHSMMGFWSVLFVLLFGVSGLYLGFPSAFTDLVDYLDPPTDANFQRRFGDRLAYWLARLHFGRFGGHPMKIVWVLFGIAPAILFVTGAVMWWTRVLRPRSRSAGRLASVRQPV
jgi:uncharacterized iron-regulated membrane protein